MESKKCSFKSVALAVTTNSEKTVKQTNAISNKNILKKRKQEEMKIRRNENMKNEKP